METEEIKNLITAGLADAQVDVDGGDGKYQVRIISAAFEGLTQVQRHQAVYATTQAQIQSGELHALSIEALTPSEAEQQ